MEALAVPILVAVVTGLLLYIMRTNSSEAHTVRDEMNAHLTAMRLEIKDLTIAVASMRGAADERAALYKFLSERLQ